MNNLMQNRKETSDDIEQFFNQQFEQARKSGVPDEDNKDDSLD